MGVGQRGKREKDQNRSEEAIEVPGVDREKSSKDTRERKGADKVEIREK